MTTRWLLIASCTLFAAQSAPLQQGDKLCGACQTSGRIAFEVPKAVIEQEKGCTFCSEVVANEAINHGLDYKPCPKCLAPSLRDAVKKLYDADVQRGLDWLKSRREIDDYIADPKNLHLMHVSTPHFELAWAIQKVKVGNHVLDQHQAMHLYAQRLESAYQAYLDQFSISHNSDQGNRRHKVMVFELAKHAQKAQPKYCGMGGQGASEGTKLLGDTSVFVTWWNKTKNRDDEEFHEYMIHNVVHMFLASYYNCFWLARKNGWIDEGLSHYFTDRLFKKCRTHCYQEQDEAANWVTEPWRPEVRKRVVANKLPVFAEVIVKHGESLTADEHLCSWSWVQYLNDAFDHKKFIQLVHGLKADNGKTPLRDLLQSIYGVTPFQFIENWKKYVIDTYPPR